MYISNNGRMEKNYFP